ASREITGGSAMKPARIAARLLAAASISVLASDAFAETRRGVTNTEVLIGTITDLSGVPAVQAMNKQLNSDGLFFTIEDGGTPDRWVSLRSTPPTDRPATGRLVGWVERSETHRLSGTPT